MTDSKGNRPFRLGIVGAGSVAALHLDAAAQAGVEVVAICDVRPAAARRMADRHGLRAYTEHTEMFAAGDLDGVVVTAPHALHAPITIDAAAAGLHVLVEKPMATTLADCRRMIEACEKHQVRLAVGHVLRFLPPIREAKRILASGRLGRPMVINERRTATYEPGSRPEWFFDPAMAGGGIVMNVGIHSIDKVQWLADGLVVRVVARSFSRAGLGVETESVGLLELANGVWAALIITSAGLPFQDETEVICEHGALRLSRRDGLWTYQDGQETQVVAPHHDEVPTAFRDQLADFVAACRADRAPAVDGEYGQSVVATVLAMYESAGRANAVPVPDLTSGFGA
ncbi:MAG: Gfo/Idh/MocA family oxidoreductase [Micromonosporaceae bacterium]